MVQNDIEDDVETEMVGGIDQAAKLIVRMAGVPGEAGIDVQKIVNAITVISASFESNILKNRA